MKIKPEVEILDDPEFCENIEGDIVCTYVGMKQGKTHCLLFFEYLEGYKKKKCDQCEADYLRAKREEPTDMITIGAYKFDCFKSRLYIGGKIIA